jgi:hypothetical protein
MLYLNGESLLHQPLDVRRQKLISSFEEVSGRFYFAKHLDLPVNKQILSDTNKVDTKEVDTNRADRKLKIGIFCSSRLELVVKV